MNHVLGGEPVSSMGNGTSWVVIGFAQTFLQSVFSTIFIRGQHTVDMLSIITLYAMWQCVLACGP